MKVENRSCNLETNIESYWSNDTETETTLGDIVKENDSIEENYKDCIVVINELNTDSADKPEKYEFIELLSTCKGKQMSIPLRGYKLILLTTGTANAKEISIELVASLWFCRTNDNGLFTIGGQSVKNADIKIPNTEVLKFTRGFNSDETVSTTNFLTNGNQYPNALAVLKGETANKVLPFSLSSKHTFLHVDNKAKADIKKDIIDMVVYGRRAPFSRLRDFDEQRSTQDLTLNRCTIKTSGFLPEYFKLGRATPGQENDCSGVHFILEDHILDAATLLSQYPDPGDEQDLHTEAQCSREQDSSS